MSFAFSIDNRDNSLDIFTDKLTGKNLIFISSDHTLLLRVTKYPNLNIGIGKTVVKTKNFVVSQNFGSISERFKDGKKSNMLRGFNHFQSLKSTFVINGPHIPNKSLDH